MSMGASATDVYVFKERLCVHKPFAFQDACLFPKVSVLPCVFAFPEYVLASRGGVLLLSQGIVVFVFVCVKWEWELLAR